MTRPGATHYSSSTTGAAAVRHRPPPPPTLRFWLRREEVGPAHRARRVRVEPSVDALAVEQVPARRMHVLEAHGARRAAVVREGRRHADDDRLRGNHEPPRLLGPQHGRGAAASGSACSPQRADDVGRQPADEAEERHGESGAGAGLDGAGEDAEQEQRQAGDDDAVAGAAPDVVVCGGGRWPCSRCCS
jgi:hypothetical protein